MGKNQNSSLWMTYRPYAEEYVMNIASEADEYITNDAVLARIQYGGSDFAPAQAANPKK